jgi:hypothetical protein
MRQSCMLDDWVTLRVTMLGTVEELVPDEADEEDNPPSRPPVFWLLLPLILEPERLYTPEDVTARSICGGPVEEFV